MAWLSGWDKRIKLTTDQTKIDTADLQWFPVTVFLSPTHGDCVFDELTSDANRFKIAFTKADGETQLYGEIEKWDDANESAIIHVSRDGWVISNTENTDFYMYYDIDHADNTDYISGSGIADIGSACTDRVGQNQGTNTFIDLANPANLTGKITNVAIYAAVSMASAKVATFYRPDPINFPNNFTARSVSGDLGTVAAGGVRNFEVNLDAVKGDFIGIYFTDEYDFIETSATGGSGVVYKSGDQTACVDATFTLLAGQANSLYGTGTTGVGCNVWDGYFKLVSHQADATTSTVEDSTSNNNNGTKTSANNPTQVAGKVGFAQSFDAAEEAITLGLFNVASVLTVEAIIKPDAGCIARDYPTIIEERVGSDDWWFLLSAGKLAATLWQSNAVAKQTNFSAESALTAGVDYYVVQLADGSNLHAYVNATEYGVAVAYNGTIKNSATASYIGKDTTAGRYWSGLIDEVRISSTNRSTAWIKATYNSLWDTLLTYGSEETEGWPHKWNGVTIGKLNGAVITKWNGVA